MMQLTTLANGLRVASRPMQSVETVAVGLYAPTGSRHEEARINGIAHLFEHMRINEQAQQSVHSAKMNSTSSTSELVSLLTQDVKSLSEP